MKLSDTQIKRIKPTTKPRKVSDGGGLFLWITPSGGRLWRWAYRYQGLAKLMTFGKYPDVTLAQARERHAEARKMQASGVDPMVERKAEKAAISSSFRSVASLWLAHWQDGKSPRHVAYVKRRMEADIFPKLGARQVAQIEAPELLTDTQRAIRPARFEPAMSSNRRAR